MRPEGSVWGVRANIGQLGHPETVTGRVAESAVDAVGVNAVELLGFRGTAGQFPQQVSGSAPHVEEMSWTGGGRRRQRGGAVSDRVV